MNQIDFTSMKSADKKHLERLIMVAVAICFKEWLRPEEAEVYAHLKRSALLQKCNEYGVFKNKNGYFKRSELDLILSGGKTMFETSSDIINVNVDISNKKK